MKQETQYEIYRNDRLVMTCPVSLRYPREIEQSLLKHGYVIKLDGKKLTKKDISS